jgi:hypothetical protein
MTNTSRMTVHETFRICAVFLLSTLTFGCSSKGSGLGNNLDGSVGGTTGDAGTGGAGGVLAGSGGSKGSGGAFATGGASSLGGVPGAGGATRSGGTPGTGGVLGTGGAGTIVTGSGGLAATGGTKAAGGAPGSGGTSGNGGVIGAGGAGIDGGQVPTGGARGSGGVSGTGGSSGIDGGLHLDSGLACPAAPPSACCYRDQDCGTGKECVGVVCDGSNSTVGVCEPIQSASSGMCWQDSDCPPAHATCQNAIVCRCGASCFAPDKAGTCGP